MNKMKSILEKKSSEIFHVSPSAKLEEILKILYEKNIGALFVIEDEEVLGLVTEKKLLDLLHIKYKNTERIKEKTAEDLMVPLNSIIIASPEDTIEKVMNEMTIHKLRYVSIMENGKLLGIVSIGDVVRYIIENFKNENKFLNDYLFGNWG